MDVIVVLVLKGDKMRENFPFDLVSHFIILPAQIINPDTQ